MSTVSNMTAMKLPILVSSREVLSGRGVLGRSWRPLWEPECPPVALGGTGRLGVGRAAT